MTIFWDRVFLETIKFKIKILGGPQSNWHPYENRKVEQRGKAIWRHHTAIYKPGRERSLGKEQFCQHLDHGLHGCSAAKSCLTLCDPMDYIAHQTSLSMGFSRQEYWSGFPFPSPGDLPDPGIEPMFHALAGEFFTIEPTGNPSLGLLDSKIMRKYFSAV